MKNKLFTNLEVVMFKFLIKPKLKCRQVEPGLIGRICTVIVAIGVGEEAKAAISAC